MPTEVHLWCRQACGGKKNNKKIDKLKNFQYIPKQLYFVKINLYFWFYIWGFAHHSVCFASPCFFCATKKQALPAFGEGLYFRLNSIFYLTCKTKLVLFNTNFQLAVFGSLTKSAERMRREKEQ